MKGKLIIFSAPSGAGKTTIVRHLLKCDLNLGFSVSATNRLPRAGETDAKDYYFISTEEFKKKIANNEFLEWEEVYNGTFYGTLISEVENIRNRGINVIFDVDVIGGLNIKTYYRNDALSVFVMPPTVDDLNERLIARSTETDEKIAIRIAKAEYEISFAEQFDKIVVNSNLDQAFADAEKTVREFLLNDSESQTTN